MRFRRVWQFQLVAGALLGAYLPACTSYHLLADPVASLQAPPKPINSVRVTLRSGEHSVLRKPTVVADSLRGFMPGGAATTLALSDIEQVEEQRTSAGKTVALAVGIVAGFGLIAGAAAASSWSSSSCTISEGEGYSW